MTSVARGRLIAFEGGEGCGKSTQARLLADHLGAVLTREPGGTNLGLVLRDLVLDVAAGPIDPRTETLLMVADRAQHVAEIVEPVLDSGRDVVSDRFAGSTLAYQGFGRGLDVSELEQLSTWASNGLEADLVIVLDVPPEVSAARVADRGRDRMEAEAVSFHQRVSEGYRTLAAERAGRWVMVDGAGSVSDVQAGVRVAFDEWAASSL